MLAIILAPFFLFYTFSFYQKTGEIEYCYHDNDLYTTRTLNITVELGKKKCSNADYCYMTLKKKNGELERVGGCDDDTKICQFGRGCLENGEGRTCCCKKELCNYPYVRSNSISSTISTASFTLPMFFYIKQVLFK